MKALFLTAANKPFRLKEIDTPAPGKGQVLVRIKASGINPLDVKIRAGQAAHAQVEFPAILGIDTAGVVESVGSEVSGFNIGDEVFGMTGGVGKNQGSLAEYIAADASLLALKPRNISMPEAAALPLVSITAWEAIIDRGKIKPGETVLIHGGAGGVGHIAVQLAKAYGAKVFATVSPENKDKMEAYGAIPIDFKAETAEQYTSRLTRGDGFDVILDTVGGDVLQNSFKIVKRYTGRVVSILGWGTHALAPLSFRGASYSGVFTLYPLLSGLFREQHGRILSNIGALAEQQKIVPRLHPTIFSMETIEEAYKIVENGTAQGKVVVSIPES